MSFLFGRFRVRLTVIRIWFTSAVVAARDAQVSATPKSTVTGTIQVKRTSDGVVLGKIDEVTNTNTGMFKYTTTSDTALKVKISLDTGATSGTGVEFTMLVCRVH